MRLWQGRTELGTERQAVCWEKEGRRRDAMEERATRVRYAKLLASKPLPRGDTQINGDGLN